MNVQAHSQMEVRPAVARLRVSRLVLLGMLVLPVGILASPDTSVASGYFRGQDWPIALAYLAALLAMTFRIAALEVPARKLGWPIVAAFFVAVAAALWWGTYGIMGNYALTRDEHMVLFDMGVFAQRHLLEPLAAEWRPYWQALVPAFALPVSDHAGLASDYLPGNAMMRLAFSQVADPALMNPFLVALAGMALFDITRRLFLDDHRAVLVTMALYILSAQLLVNAMTAYAMTGHTALNLIWLMLFLRDRPWAHAGAMAISLWAVGLHQVVFHPLFAGPFLLWRLGQGRYALFAVYTAVFVTALAAWSLYPSWAIRSSGVLAAAGATSGKALAGAGSAGYFWRDRVLPILMDRNSGTILAVVLNLIRYVAWQHLALVPLMFAAWPLVRGNVGIALPLAAGIMLTLAFCAVVLPFQGHGWGYRYLCGVLGNGVLLAGLGYRHWAEKDRAAADGLFLCLSALTLVALTYLLARTHQFVAPYVSLDKAVSAYTSDMVLIDTEPPSMAIDQVRNSADLSNRPLRLSSRDLDAVALRELCRRGTIALVTRADMHRAGFAREYPAASPLFAAKVAQGLGGKPCLVANARQ